MNGERPCRIGLTLGDPAGIGPETALRVAADWSDSDPRCLLLIGDDGLLRKVGQKLNLPVPRRHVGSLSSLPKVGCWVVQASPIDGDDVVPGQWSPKTGQASYEWVCTAVQAAMDQQIDAVVTGPIQKEAWHSAGIGFPGHTELLAHMTGTEHFRMMLTSRVISCLLVTIHTPIADVPSLLRTRDIYESIKLAADTMQRRHRRPARVAVCGLNPHAGENGLFSHGEEEQVILPAIQQARRDGFDVVGPLSPDTAFVPAMRAKTDVYVCMYHDQGLIPLKALSFDDGVNVTLGLPIIRTSVDHGTAMDIAWKGLASDRSLRAAIELAIELI